MIITNGLVPATLLYNDLRQSWQGWCGFSIFFHYCTLLKTFLWNSVESIDNYMYLVSYVNVQETENRDSVKKKRNYSVNFPSTLYIYNIKSNQDSVYLHS